MNDIEKVRKILIDHEINEIEYYNQFGIWQEFCLVRQATKKGIARVVESKFKELYSWERDRKPDIMNESTFSECVFMTILLETSQLKILMYDGDSLYGQPTTERCSWIVEIDNFASFDFIARKINSVFVNLAYDLREQELKKIEIQRRNEIMENLLAKYD